MVASNIQFLDDTGLALGHAPVHQEALTAGNGSLEPQDDVFYLSRLNDPTTYFFQWICKRYRLTVKSEETECPICLDRTHNNIQLSCGAWPRAPAGVSAPACLGSRISRDSTHSHPPSHHLTTPNPHTPP